MNVSRATSCLLLVCAAPLLAGSLSPVNLRCEYVQDPLGIDTPQPRLSWWLQPKSDQERGLKQETYRVLVASSAAKLKAGEADLWDSGRVLSDQSIHVRYAGRALVSGQ